MSTHAHGPWLGEPWQCTCARLVAATLEETLGCPYAWWYAPGIGWLHPLPPRRSSARAGDPEQAPEVTQ